MWVDIKHFFNYELLKHEEENDVSKFWIKKG